MNQLLKKTSSNRIFAHIMFWVAFTCFFGIMYGSHEKNNFWNEVISQIMVLPAYLLLVYPSLYFIIPKFLLRQKIAVSVLSFTLLIFAAIVTLRCIAWFIIYPLYYQDGLTCEQCDFWMPYKLLYYGVMLSAVLFLTTLIKMLKLWYQNQKNTQSLEQEKLEAELKFLKGQIHPHFLFNTLNNLYALTLKNDDRAPEVVLKISELMNYMLYETNSEWVSLEKEINYLKNYISLERIRYGKRVDVNFNISGEVYNRKVAPMLLLPFIENSFKHGVSGQVDNAWVEIDLSVKENRLTLKVENSRPPLEVNHSDKDYAKGIGLKNVKRRLELLYPNEYELKVFDESDTYLVVLKLNLEENLAIQYQNTSEIYETTLSYRG